MEEVYDSIDDVILSVYETMSGEFSSMIAFGQAIGLFGALCYVFYRIWESWTEAQPIPVFPLLRPIALAFLLAFYPGFIGIIKNIADYVEQGTASLGEDKAKEINLLAQKIESAKNTYYLEKLAREKADPTVGQQFANALGLGGLSDMVSYGMTSIGDTIKEAVLFLFECFFVAARLMIKAFSVFFLIILFLFGPLVIGLACFDWFYSSLPGYVAKIINLFLWAPIANMIVYMLRHVQIAVMQRTLALYTAENSTGNEYTSFDFAMIVFYIIGTGCFLYIPTISGWLVQGIGGESMSRVGSPLTGLASVGGAAAGRALGRKN